MNFYFLIYQILVVIVDFLGLGLGILVLTKNSKDPKNQLFFLMTFFALGWITFAYLSDLPSLFSYSLLINRTIYFFLSFFFLSAYFFSLFFPQKKRSSPLFNLINTLYLLFGILIALFSLFTSLIIKDVKKVPWGTDLILGPLFPLFFILGMSWIASICFLLKKFFNLRPLEKLRVKYFFIGFLIFFLANIIFNAILPQVRGTYEYYWFGNLSIIFFLGFTGYAIFAKHLFNIKIVLTELLVGLIAIILLFQTLISQTLFLRIINFSVFLLYCFFGYLLIRSILQEIKLREQLEAANKELKRLDEAKTEFLSIASHQLRTPLTAIKGYLGMIEEGIYGEVPEKVKEVLHKVDDSNERLIRLVNSLLDISRLELGRMQFDIEKVDIEEMLENIIDEFHVAARKKGLKLVFEHPKEKLPEVKIDPLKMRQVFLNLVDNAIKYTYQGEVIVKAELKDHGRERIRISVSDTGIGIARKEINEIFKIYRRGTGVRLFPEGSGVGLYVAKKLIEAHKGRIWVESKGKGRGSTFYVEIPVKK